VIDARKKAIGSNQRKRDSHRRGRRSERRKAFGKKPSFYYQKKKVSQVNPGKKVFGGRKENHAKHTKKNSKKGEKERALKRR